MSPRDSEIHPELRFHGKARDPIGRVITGVRNTVMNKLNHVRIARMI
jgi:hypothetical protein